jgi:murein DD-endopeptidase MepM/ murein hydrolase activator NlpD
LWQLTTLAALLHLLTGCTTQSATVTSTTAAEPRIQSTTTAPVILTTTTLPPTTTTTTTAAPATATSTIPPEPVHVFPLDPPDAGSYSPGGHAYLATDIFAPTGAGFAAVTSGVVQGVSRTDFWDPDVNDGANRGGLFVSLIGDDGVRYYGSHLSAVTEGIDAGVRVEAGQLLGLVGISGSARDTPPHLHFGISRPTTLDDWEVRRGEVDPVPFLDAWLAGDTTATPTLEAAAGG